MLRAQQTTAPPLAEELGFLPELDAFVPGGLRLSNLQLDSSKHAGDLPLSRRSCLVWQPSRLFAMPDQNPSVRF